MGGMGIQYVAKLSLYLNLIPFLMILLVFAKTAPGIPNYVPADPNPYFAFTLLLQIVIGFFATAGPARAAFCMNSRTQTHVPSGGPVAPALALPFPRGPPLLSPPRAPLCLPPLQ